jgi:hypothetical protein
MDQAYHRLISALHASSYQIALAVTGGGATAVGLLLSVPGAARTILEAVVPYHDGALSEYLGNRPAQFCSIETSQALAVRALDRARKLAPAGSLLGVGCTASLATDRPKQGEHRFHLSVCSESGTTTYSLVFHKSARARFGEESVLDAVLLNALAEGVGIAERVLPALFPGEFVTRGSAGGGLLDQLIHGDFRSVCCDADGRLSREGQAPRALLPGAFNPIHQGHWRLAELAQKLVGEPVAFELSIQNVDKPTLTFAETRRRLDQFTWRLPAWLTRAPTFREKAALFPGAVFVVGADTAERILSARYYGGAVGQMIDALAFLRAQGCRFLVAGRENAQGSFIELQQIEIPEGFQDLFTGIDKTDFCVPLSSTAIRNRAASPVCTPVGANRELV